MDKNTLINDVQQRLIHQLTAEQVDIVINTMLTALAEYSVQKVGTEIAILDDYNDVIIKRYVACLLIDNRSKRTIEEYVSTIKKFADFCNKNLNEVDIYDVRRFLGEAKMRCLKTATLINIRSYLVSFFRWMVDEDEIGKSPCDRISSIKQNYIQEKSFTNIEIDTMRNGITNIRNRAMMEFLLSSGIRVNELCTMLVNDVDLNTNDVFVRNGKGNKQRTTYIDDIARHYLKIYLDNRKTNSIYLFCKNDGSALTTSGVEKLFARVALKLNIERIHPHKFRRTFATELSRKGMPIQNIQKLMGHSSINITMRYIVLDDSNVKMAYQKCL